jgi:hypothetical protein
LALSDSCLQFLLSVGEAAAQLAKDAHYYSHPEYPIQYGTEVDVLRRACLDAAECPYDPGVTDRVVRLALAIVNNNDTPPGGKSEDKWRRELDLLVRTIQSELGADDAAAVPTVVEQVVSETPFTKQAAERLKSMLSKLGKPAYDIAIKIIGDIGSETVKRMLRL